MLRIVCWKWKPHISTYRSKFSAEHVNTLRNMVARHYRSPHEMVCITDDPTGIDGDIRIVPLWSDHANVMNPHGIRNPSCYRRLKIFSKEAADFIGPRFVSIDLDVVITGDMRPVWDRDIDFMIWGDTAVGTPYNGSMFMMNAGARSQVWEQFDPVRSPALGRQKKYIGSDQAWIAACLGPNEKKWTRNDGVYSFRNEVMKTRRFPSDARIVIFHGQFDPWMQQVQLAHPWIKHHYV